MKPYPTWCCYECGKNAREFSTKAGHKVGPMILVSTYHEDTCDVCGETKSVTEPRDFGYPIFDGHTNYVITNPRDYSHWKQQWAAVEEYKRLGTSPAELAYKYSIPMEKMIGLLKCYGY